MPMGALISAYQEADSGGLRALLPLAGRTLLEYQARCASAVGASPIVVMIERIPAALNRAFDGLLQEGIEVVVVTDAVEAAERFDPAAMVMLIGDGIAPPLDLLTQLNDEQEATVISVPDDEAHQQFERMDAVSRWAGVALVQGQTVGSTAAMLGDWDLQSTLLRRALQEGAVMRPVDETAREPLLATSEGALDGFERSLLSASRRTRTDLVSRYLLPPLEEFATRQLMDTKVRPEWMIYSALALTVGAAFLLARGWLASGTAALLLSLPLDLVADRLASLRLRPLRPRMLARRLLWPAAGAALLGLGWWQIGGGSGFGPIFAAATAAAFAEAARLERSHVESLDELWLFGRRNAVLAALPFAIFGLWLWIPPLLAIYAAASFFTVQHIHHRLAAELTPH